MAHGDRLYPGSGIAADGAGASWRHVIAGRGVRAAHNADWALLHLAPHGQGAV